MTLVKECHTCATTKPLDAFGKNHRGKYGRGSQCKACVSERYQRYYAELTPEQQRARRERNKSYKRKIGLPVNWVGSVDWVAALRLVDVWQSGDRATNMRGYQSAGTRWVAFCEYVARVGSSSGSGVASSKIVEASKLGAKYNWRRMTVSDVVASLTDVRYVENRLLESV